MLIKKLTMLVLIVNSTVSNTNLTGVVPQGSYGDVLYIEDILGGIKYSYHQRLAGKANIAQYVYKMGSIVQNCRPNTLITYKYIQGEIYFSNVKKYEFSNQAYNKLINLSHIIDKIPATVKHKCQGDILLIFVYYPGKNVKQHMINFFQNDGKKELSISQQDSQNKHSIVKLNNQVSQSLKKLELLYLYKFRLFQARSVYIQEDIIDGDDFVYEDIIAPQVTSFASHYRIQNNTLYAIYIAQEDYQKENQNDPANNTFSQDLNMEAPTTFLFQVDVNSNGIQVIIQNVKIGEGNTVEYHHFKNCQSTQVIEQEQLSEIQIEYKLQPGQNTKYHSNYQKILEYQNQANIQDLQYAFSDIPFDMKKSQCQIRFIQDQEQGQVSRLEIKLVQNDLNKNLVQVYKNTNKTLERNKSQNLDEAKFDDALNKIAFQNYNKNPHVVIEENELSIFVQGQQIKCQKVFEGIGQELSQDIQKLQFFNYLEQDQNTFHEMNLQWRKSQSSKVSHLYIEQGQTFQQIQFQSLKQCKLIAIKNNSIHIAIQSQNRNLVKFQSEKTAENKLTVQVISQENQNILECSSQLQNDLPEFYQVQYSYMKPGQEPNLFRYNGAVQRDAILSTYQDDFVGLNENISCLVDTTILDSQRFVEVVFYDNPQGENKIHYVKAYFQNDNILVYEMTPSLQSNVKTYTNLKYERLDQVVVARNFNQQTVFPDSWEQSKIKGDSNQSDVAQRNINSFQRVLYFDNKVKDQDQTYVAQFYSKENIGDLFFLIAIKNKFNPKLDQSNDEQRYEYWIVQVFYQPSDVLSLLRTTVHDLKNSNGSNIAKDYGVSVKTRLFSFNEYYQFKTFDQTNKLLKTNQTNIKLQENQPIVLLFLPTTSTIPNQITLKDTSVDFGSSIVNTILKFQPLTRII